jgi:hypothetical protein
MQIFESLILNQLNAFIVKYNLLTETQYGIRTSLNTNILLTDLIHSLTLVYNDPNLIAVDIIVLDYKKAFHSIYHGLIFENLFEIGLRGNFLFIMCSLLGNRTHSVEFKDIISKISVTSDVLQGGKTHH